MEVVPATPAGALPSEPSPSLPLSELPAQPNSGESQGAVNSYPASPSGLMIACSLAHPLL